MGGRTLGRKDVHILIPETCEHVTLYGKRDFADITKNLETVDSPGLRRWAQCYHKGPDKREAGAVESEEMWQQRQRSGDAGTSRLDTGKGKETDSRPASPERNSALLTHFRL